MFLESFRDIDLVVPLNLVFVDSSFELVFENVYGLLVISFLEKLLWTIVSLT